MPLQWGCNTKTKKSPRVDTPRALNLDTRAPGLYVATSSKQRTKYIMTSSRINYATEWTNKVRDSDLSANAKLVAYTIRSYLNGESITAWPSIPTLCKQTSLSRSSVIRAVNELRADGYLLTVSGREGKSTRYTIAGGVTQTLGGCHTDTRIKQVNKTNIINRKTRDIPIGEQLTDREWCK